ncbi:MAG: hypothetical protein F6J93_03840 [Oscillatoria sp. SIO1A7]|nr:hypothetical protein [Oscillatoria sp. SIO1A7]
MLLPTKGDPCGHNWRSLAELFRELAASITSYTATANTLLGSSLTKIVPRIEDLREPLLSSGL